MVAEKVQHSVLKMVDQMVASKADEMAVMLVYKWDTIWAASMV